MTDVVKSAPSVPLASLTIREAKPSDIRAVCELIQPFEESGQLRFRGLEGVRDEIQHMWLAKVEDVVVGCFALYPRDSGDVELGCLVASDGIRNRSIGQDLLEFAEQIAVSRGFSRMYALTTQMGDWFMSQGFSAGGMHDLSAQRQKAFDRKRNPRIFVKHLTRAKST